jgi:lipid II:glycine glycyltransferase (peptidoglycan interpeptide bridge formation enzyme)
MIVSANKVREGWQLLVEQSPYATFFQTEKAYDFYRSQSYLDTFALAVIENNQVTGVAVGYIQSEKGIKSYFSKRAIIMGGLLLDTGISNEALSELLQAIKMRTSKAIYVEIRNHHDYGAFAPVFTQNGFDYQPHLNVKITCDTWQDALNRMDTNRRRVLKNFDECCNRTILESQELKVHQFCDSTFAKRTIASPHHGITESPYYCYATTKEQVRQYYALLRQHYKTKVRKPLFPYAFFESLVTSQTGKLLLLYTADKLIGGMVQVELPGKVVYDYYACALDEAYKELSPSVLLYGITMQQAINDGVKVFDTMGAGKPDIPYGVRDFKLRFGGTLVQEGRFLLLHRPFLYKIGAWAVKFFS